MLDRSTGCCNRDGVVLWSLAEKAVAVVTCASTQACQRRQSSQQDKQKQKGANPASANPPEER
jgi:hypothetical protein